MIIGLETEVAEIRDAWIEATGGANRGYPLEIIPAPEPETCEACDGAGLVLPGAYLGEPRPGMPARPCTLCGGFVRSGVRPVTTLQPRRR